MLIQKDALTDPSTTSRTAYHFLSSLALVASLSVTPPAPALAWMAPPTPLPMEPTNPDGIDDTLGDDRSQPPYVKSTHDQRGGLARNGELEEPLYKAGELTRGLLWLTDWLASTH